MKKGIRIILIVLLVFLVLIQFKRPQKNNSGDVAYDIATKYTIPDNVQRTLQTACYDCHSNNSEYPWYWNVQPVAWYMNKHIKEGKRHLNFSAFASYTTWRQYRKLDEINDEIESGEMPITSYKLIHADARLSDQQKIDIANWVNSAMKYMEQHNPPDSLKRPAPPPAKNN